MGMGMGMDQVAMVTMKRKNNTKKSIFKMAKD